MKVTPALRRKAQEHENMHGVIDKLGLTPQKRGKHMPGKKKRFSAKQDRMASHVAKSMRKRGKSAEEAESIGYATVNKNKKKKKARSSKDSQGRNVATKTKPKRKASNRKSRNKGRV